MYFEENKTKIDNIPPNFGFSFYAQKNKDDSSFEIEEAESMLKTYNVLNCAKNNLDSQSQTLLKLVSSIQAKKPKQYLQAIAKE